MYMAIMSETSNMSAMCFNSIFTKLILGCNNGECHGDQCVCNSGYTLDPTRKFCAPVCSPDCGRGNCTAPNVCSCNNGYELSGDGQCIPKCSKGCQFGECTAPEVCSCRSGYVLQGENCAPVCQRFGLF